MRIIGCGPHARQQTLAMLDTATGEVVHKALPHEGESVREFYSTLPGPVRVGIEATGSMKWFLHLMEELGIDCQVGHPATIRAAELASPMRSLRWDFITCAATGAYSVFCESSYLMR
jgi:hypothetical protein